jgi:hypothetical protein
MVTNNMLKALEEFASDTNISFLFNTNISEISFASAKHFEEFGEETRQDLVRIAYSVFKGLATNMEIMGITEEEIQNIIIDKCTK